MYIIVSLFFIPLIFISIKFPILYPITYITYILILLLIKYVKRNKNNILKIANIKYNFDISYHTGLDCIIYTILISNMDERLYSIESVAIQYYYNLDEIESKMNNINIKCIDYIFDNVELINKSNL